MLLVETGGAERQRRAAARFFPLGKSVKRDQYARVRARGDRKLSANNRTRPKGNGTKFVPNLRPETRSYPPLPEYAMQYARKGRVVTGYSGFEVLIRS